MLKPVRDYLTWLYWPRRYFDKDKRPYLRIPGWETLAFIDQPNELAAVRKATGDLYLGGKGNAFLGSALGQQSVFLLDQAAHKQARKILGPALSRTIAVSDQPMIDRIIREELTKLPKDATLNLGEWSRFLTLRILCRVVLGWENTEQIKVLFQRLEATTGLLANLVAYCRFFWKDRAFTPGGYAASLVSRIDEMIYPAIYEAQVQYQKAPEAPMSPVLKALVKEQEQSGYDDVFIRDNLVSVLTAGYDTTGCALSWTLFWAAQEPNLFEQACQKYQHTNNTESLDAFRNEVLRYCPPIEILPRCINPDKKEEAQEHLASLQQSQIHSQEKPAMVCPFVHRARHNPDTFSKPEQFNPDRFLEKKTYRQHEYFPFGMGERTCVGIHYGKLILDRLLVVLAEEEMAITTKKRRFRPIRRNVSIWPAVYFSGIAIKSEFTRPK